MKISKEQLNELKSRYPVVLDILDVDNSVFDDCLVPVIERYLDRVRIYNAFDSENNLRFMIKSIVEKDGEILCEYGVNAESPYFTEDKKWFFNGQSAAEHIVKMKNCIEEMTDECRVVLNGED